jgi:protein tyrosine phosphatase (PTP) superfamily phosphohydrolase (DUF442 family)
MRKQGLLPPRSFALSVSAFAFLLGQPILAEDTATVAFPQVQSNNQARNANVSDSNQWQSSGSAQPDPLHGQQPDLSHLNLPALRQTRVLIPNLHLVTPMLLRGAQPSADALLLLKQSGVKTIVNLRNEDVMVKQEAEQAKILGLRYISIPLDVFNRPSDAAIQKFIAIATNPDDQPVYVHCLHGEDRTGTMCAIYRLTQEGWTFDNAYQEMISLGFKPMLGQLTQTVYDYANRPAKPAQPAQLVVEGIKNKIHGMVRKKP